MIRLFIFLFCTVVPTLVFSQQSEDERLLRLIDAKTAEIVQIDGRDLRKVIGPAQFLHNNTLILCDSAIWDVLQNTLDAQGNVQIIQNQTTLRSDLIHYIANLSLAQARGNVVELIDKDKNRLRTSMMDFYTKDSIGYFSQGGSVLDKNKNIIESIQGSYNAKLKVFKFYGNVEVKSDSVKMKADSLAYYSKENVIRFLGQTHAWNDSSYLRANGGYYDRANQYYRFTDRVYIKTAKQEIWANTVVYNKLIGSSELFDNIQISDTTKKAIFFADYVKYTNNPLKITFTKSPSVAYYSLEKGKTDTLYLSADTLCYMTKKMFEIDSATVSQAKDRLALSKKDPVRELLNTMSQKTASKPVVEPLSTAQGKPAKKIETIASTAPKIDSIKTALTDSIPKLILDSLDNLLKKPDSDTIQPTRDTSSIRFVYAYHNVKIHRSDIQGLCDSLIFTSLDSIARMYKNPILWNESNQFTADSIQFIITDNKLSKAELLSSAFVVSQEDSVHYNQLKGTDIVGYFNNNEIYRFDALGGVSLVFYFKEDSIVTTMNQKECRMMRADILEKKIQKIYYYQEIKSDAYPVFNLPINKQKLKGFNWRIESRPKNRFDVCTRNVRKSERVFTNMLNLPIFVLTKRFFK